MGQKETVVEAPMLAVGVRTVGRAMHVGRQNKTNNSKNQMP